MHLPKVVIPAKAGCVTKKTLDSRFHGNDEARTLLEQVIAPVDKWFVIPEGFLSGIQGVCGLKAFWIPA